MSNHLKKTLTLGVLSLCAATTNSYGQATDAGAPTQPPKLWDTSAAVGLTLTRGNSKTFSFNGNVQAARKWDKNELNLGADATYAENDGDKSADNYRAFVQYNRLFGERLFAYARVEGLHDEIADVAYRVTISPGGGYYFIKSATASLRGEIGPGFVLEKQGGKSDSYVTLRLAERYDQKISERVKVWQTLEFLPQVDRFENFIINAEIGLETALSTHLSQRTYIQDTYHSKPAPGREKNDVKLVAAIAYKF